MQTDPSSLAKLLTAREVQEIETLIAHWKTADLFIDQSPGPASACQFLLADRSLLLGKLREAKDVIEQLKKRLPRSDGFNLALSDDFLSSLSDIPDA